MDYLEPIITFALGLILGIILAYLTNYLSNKASREAPYQTYLRIFYYFVSSVNEKQDAKSLGRLYSQIDLEVMKAQLEEANLKTSLGSDRVFLATDVFFTSYGHFVEILRGAKQFEENYVEMEKNGFLQILKVKDANLQRNLLALHFEIKSLIEYAQFLIPIDSLHTRDEGRTSNDPLGFGNATIEIIAHVASLTGSLFPYCHALEPQLRKYVK